MCHQSNQKPRNLKYKQNEAFQKCHNDLYCGLILPLVQSGIFLCFLFNREGGVIITSYINITDYLNAQNTTFALWECVGVVLQQFISIKDCKIYADRGAESTVVTTQSTLLYLLLCVPSPSKGQLFGQAF